MDVKTAFLNDFLEEEIYMEQPEGFIDPNHPNKVCKLQRSIYGLKQASRSWNKRFDEEIKKFGFHQNLDEPCAYQKASGSNVIFIILYVDDIILMGNHIPSLQEVKDYLGKCFSMKDLGETAFILGIKIYRDRSRRLIGLSQNAYLDKILKRYRMDNSKRGSIPMQVDLHLIKISCAYNICKMKRLAKLFLMLRLLGSFCMCEMAHNNAQTKTNSSAFRSMLEKHQLTGPNFNEWLRTLKLVVRTEKLQDVFETPLPPDVAPRKNVELLVPLCKIGFSLSARAKWVSALEEVATKFELLPPSFLFSPSFDKLGPRIFAINLDDYQLDPITPPPSPSSLFLMAAYQWMIAETDPTQREEALTAYGTETGQNSVSVPETVLTELEAFMRLWDVKPRVEERSLETLSLDELITQLRQMSKDAEDRASNAQEEARQKRNEALEEVIQRIYRNNN
ncbi:retrotransposon protein, putative, ty1-copia subclass [Tanacetum coccineum]